MHNQSLHNIRIDSFSKIDKKIALSFGLLIFFLMLVVLVASGWYLRNLMEYEHNRLATITTEVVAKAVNRISFSGKYQTRLFLEELKKDYHDLHYIRLLDAQGNTVADSNPEKNDTFLGAAERNFITNLLSGSNRLVVRDFQYENGEMVREISVAYQGGFNNEVTGVIQVGILDTARETAFYTGVLYIITLFLLLLVVGIIITFKISKIFGLPVRQLATDMANERQRLENIIDAMHAGTWEWNISNDSVVFNERWAEIAGYTLKELEPLSGETFIKLCHPDDLQNSKNHIEDHFIGRSEQYVCESRMLHKDGHWVWVLDSGRIVKKDEYGKPIKMMGTRQDISLRKQAEEDYRQESQRFMLLAKVSNTGVWEWDSKKNILWCNPEYFLMLGYDDEIQPTGFYHVEDAWLRFLHPEDTQRARGCFADYLSAGSPGLYECEFRMRHRNGDWIWIWARGSTLRDDSNQLTARTIGTHTNITSIKEVQARLRESQERLQLIGNNIPDSMVFQLDCGKSGEIRKMIYVSAGVQRMHGVSVDEVLNNFYILHAQIHQEDRPILESRQQDCIKSMSDFRMEVRSIIPDGTMRWFMIISSPRKLEDGTILFDGIEMDITERKNRERQIYELNENLENKVKERTLELSAALDRLRHTQSELLQNEKLASLGALVAGVAHELNTPIGNAVTVASTLVKTHQRFSEVAKSGLTRSALSNYLNDVEEGGIIIERNLTRAAELIGSFKQLAVDQTSYQRRDFELGDIIQEIFMAMRPTIKKTKFELLEDIEEKFYLNSYPGPLGQVLMNLINNAILHAFDGRDTGFIRVRTYADTQPGWVCIGIHDNGCGISPEHQKKVFDPFFTTKMGQGGSGLGLHISYTLVTGLLGGRMELESTLQQGSDFILRLPLVAPAITSAKEAMSAVSLHNLPLH